MESATFIALLGIASLVVAFGLRVLPVGTCPQCEHCRLEKQRQEAEFRERTRSEAPECPVCQRSLDVHERHRS
jgi:hypothetical protein